MYWVQEWTMVLYAIITKGWWASQWSWCSLRRISPACPVCYHFLGGGLLDFKEGTHLLNSWTLNLRPNLDITVFTRCEVVSTNRDVPLTRLCSLQGTHGIQWNCLELVTWRAIVKECSSSLLQGLPTWALFEVFWKNSSYVSGVSVCIFVALYLCMLGCLLQEPIRLKVLWVDA